MTSGGAAPVGRRLAPSFYRRDAVVVARDLVGRVIRRDDVALRITETEAYRWPGDSACHARSGRTARNAPLWGPPGLVYVYLCYGLHQMLNVVTGRDGEAQAVLIRAGEVVRGMSTVRARRGSRSGPALLTGPGKVGQALALDTSWCGHSLFERGGLTLHRGFVPPDVLVGPRVGIEYAQPAHRRLLWRFALPETNWVSARRGLRPG